MATTRPNLQAITNAGAPGWTGVPAPTVLGSAPTGAQDLDTSGTIAYVTPGQPQINVMQPGKYTPVVAAHEEAHEFQNGRNGDFQRASQALLPGGNPLPKDYDYGGIPGLQANQMLPANQQKSIGNYNPEQQATMVGDLTKAQDALPSKMSPAQLQQWDTTKNTLERPIRQLMQIPPPNTSLAGKADEWLAERPIGKFLDHPFTRLAGQFSTPALQVQPQPAVSAPSVALGYANKSKLVR
jgi:hypothetical protein